MPHPLDDAAVVPPALAEAVSRISESSAGDVIRMEASLPSDALHEESAAEFAEELKVISPLTLRLFKLLALSLG